MKLAKKMLACVIALAMVAALALTAFAAAPSLKVSYKAEGTEKVYVTISGVDMAGFSSGNLELSYDPAYLEFVPATEDNVAASPAFIAVGGIPEDKTAEDGVLTAAIMFMAAATADMDLVVYEFNVLQEGTSKVTVSASNWEGVESSPASVSKNITVAAPTTAAPTTAAPTTAAPTTAAPVEDESAPVSTTAADEIPQTGDVGVAAIAGVMALAAVAFVATRKKDAE